MCIFGDDVAIVKNTRIFVAPTKGGHQITVYQNTIQSFNKNAMILPIPINTSKKIPHKSIQLLDLSTDNNLFDNLDKIFLKPPPYQDNNWGYDHDNEDSDDYHEVYKIGLYKMSIIPNINSIDRLNIKEFNIKASIFESLRGHYLTGFAFLVCQFDGQSEKEKMHPIGYIHDSYMNDGKKVLFVPTLHIHDGEIHKMENFDHLIFSLKTDVGDEPFQNDKKINQILQKNTIDAYINDRDKKTIRRLKLEGELDNIDIMLSLN